MLRFYQSAEQGYKSGRKLLHRQDYRKRRIKQKQGVRFVYSIQCTNKRHQSVQTVQTAGKMQGVQPAFFRDNSRLRSCEKYKMEQQLQESG